MKFEVYADREIFETILLDSNIYKNWNNILKYHSDVYINMSQNDYDLDISDPENSILFQYLKESGGKEPTPDEVFFNDFKIDDTVVVNKPLSTYFLDLDDSQILKLKEKFGLLFHNYKIDDQVLSQKFQKNCTKNEIFNHDSLVGWESFIPSPKYFFNSLILTDPYLFSNDTMIGGTPVNIGIKNIIAFLDLVLPHKLQIEFHLLIISSESKAGFTESKAQGIYDELSIAINLIRSYSIKLELVFTPDVIHRRNAFTNYYTFICDKGFKLFSVADLSKILDDNKFQSLGIFEINNPTDGDSNFKELIEELPKAKAGINNADWLHN